jgi:DNA-binding transcriptional regulator/RsmH inhibitor MraZ
MLKKSLLFLLGALMLILWASQPGQSQPAPGMPPKPRTCGDLWPVEQNNKWGYIDKTGRLVIPFKFDDARDFSEGLAPVLIKDKWGYIDATGKVVIPPRFDGAFHFSSGMALVVLRLFEKGVIFMNKLGYIDRSGKVAIQLKKLLDSKSLRFDYNDLIFSEGLVGVERHNKYGYMDKAGRLVIPPQYNNIQAFSEGLAAVSLEGKYGYIDRSGKMVIPPQFTDAAPFSEGLAGAHKEKQGGYIDKSGHLVISGEEFKVMRQFSEGLAAVMGKDDKWGFIDKTGKFVISPQFQRVGDFFEGLAAIELAPGDLAYIKKSGEIVIKSMSTLPNRPRWADLDLHYYRFCGGVARVGLGDEKNEDAEGYINKEGKFIWPAVTPAKEELH